MRAKLYKKIFPLLILCVLLFSGCISRGHQKHVELPLKVNEYQKNNCVIHRNISIAGPNGWLFYIPSKKNQEVLLYFSDPSHNIKGRVFYLELVRTTDAYIIEKIYNNNLRENLKPVEKEIVKIDNRSSLIVRYKLDISEKNNSLMYTSAFIPAIKGAYIIELTGANELMNKHYNKFKDIIYSFRYHAYVKSARLYNNDFAFISNDMNLYWIGDIKNGIYLYGRLQNDLPYCNVFIHKTNVNALTPHIKSQIVNKTPEKRIHTVIQNQSVIVEVYILKEKNENSSVAYIFDSNETKEKRIVICKFEEDVSKSVLLDVHKTQQIQELFRYELIW